MSLELIAGCAATVFGALNAYMLARINEKLAVQENRLKEWTFKNFVLKEQSEHAGR